MFPIFERESSMEFFAKVVLSNYQNRLNSKKQNHSFIICYNGSSIGKTRVNRSIQQMVLKHLQQSNKNQDLASIIDNAIVAYLDFSNGFNHNAMVDNISATVSLGVRLAAQLLAHQNLDNFISLYDISRFNELTFARVTSEIARIYHLKTSGPMAFFIQLDECQRMNKDSIQPKAVQRMMHAIGHYMCPQVEENECAPNDSVFIIPQIIGTSVLDTFDNISDFNQPSLFLQPLSQHASREIVKQFTKVEYSFWNTYYGIRLLDSLGGLPQFVVYLVDAVNELSDQNINEDSIHFIANKVCEQICSIYCKTEKGSSTNSLIEQFKGVQNLKKLMHIVLSGILVSLNDKLPDTDKTYGELMQTGLFIQSKDRLCLSFVLLYILNEFTYVIPNELLKYDPCEVWYWQQFAELDVFYEELRNNQFIETGHEFIRLEDFYNGAYGNQDILNLEIQLKKMKRASEIKHFLKKGRVVAGVIDKIEVQTSAVPLYLSQGNVIFRCVAGNPSVDSRCVRFQAHEETPLLIVKDGKHSVGKAYAPAKDIIKWHHQAMLRLHKYSQIYKVIYILLTNCKVEMHDRIDALTKCPNLLIICSDNLSTYMPPSLANRGLVVDDTEPEGEEEWINQE